MGLASPAGAYESPDQSFYLGVASKRPQFPLTKTYAHPRTFRNPAKGDSNRGLPQDKVSLTVKENLLVSTDIKACLTTTTTILDLLVAENKG